MWFVPGVLSVEEALVIPQYPEILTGLQNHPLERDDPQNHQAIATSHPHPEGPVHLYLGDPDPPPTKLNLPFRGRTDPTPTDDPRLDPGLGRLVAPLLGAEVAGGTADRQMCAKDDPARIQEMPAGVLDPTDILESGIVVQIGEVRFRGDMGKVLCIEDGLGAEVHLDDVQTVVLGHDPSTRGGAGGVRAPARVVRLHLVLGVEIRRKGMLRTMPKGRRGHPLRPPLVRDPNGPIQTLLENNFMSFFLGLNFSFPLQSFV